MGRLVENILTELERVGEEPGGSGPDGLRGHLDPEDIARLVEGRAEPDERRRCLHHLSRCRTCCEILNETLIDLSEEPAGEDSPRAGMDADDSVRAPRHGHTAEAANTVERTRRPPAERRPRLFRGPALALAASLFFTVLLAGGVYYKFLHTGPPALTASVRLDPALGMALAEGGSLVWEGERADRLAGLLRERGVELRGVQRIVLASLYSPPVTKSLALPKETLLVRIDGNVVRLQVIREETPARPGKPR